MMHTVFNKENGNLMGHIGRTPQAVRSFMLNKARKIRRSRSASHGRSQQRTPSEDAELGADDVIMDGNVTQDSERSGRRLSTFVHGVQNLKRRLAARQLGSADADRRHQRFSLDSRSSDGSELSSSSSAGSEPATVGSNRSSLLSNMSSSSEESETGYRGPTVGRARARCDYVPSPYDREALRFSRGDVIDVISMNPSGLWRGALHGRVGTFKFINVEVLRDERARPEAGGAALPPLRARPPSVRHLLDELGLPEYASIFSLHGFDRVEDFHTLEAEQLSDLGIVDPAHRSSLLGAAQVLTAGPEAYSPDPLCDFSQPLLSELIRDSVCYDVWRLAEGAADDTGRSRPDSEPAPPPQAGSEPRPGSSEPERITEPPDDTLPGAEETAATIDLRGRPQDRCQSEEDRCQSEEDRCQAEVGRCQSEEDQCQVGADRCQSEEDQCQAEAGRCQSEEDRCRAEACQCQPEEDRRLPEAEPRHQRTVAVRAGSPVGGPAPSSERRSTSPQGRTATSQARAAVDFKRKFQDARSVFEPECVRRQIPVGVRSRPALGPTGAVVVGDEVTV